jgi:transposase-like protein
MSRPDFPKTILEFQRRFSTEEACREYLYQSRWPEGFVCPRCGGKDPAPISTRPLIRCRDCNYQVSLTAGTVMDRTRTPIMDWFWASYLASTMTPGVSAFQFQRQTGIPRYETAFNMLHKLRAAMYRPGRDKIHGVVEVDETYIGGPHEGKGGRGAEGKVIVVGAVEVLSSAERQDQKRVPRLRMRVVPDVGKRSLIGFIMDNIEPDSLIITDNFSTYDVIPRNYQHKLADSKTGMEHIHRIFGNLKTWLEGTHHGVSAKHLQAYLNEFTFRHNRRRTPMAAFQTALGLASQKLGPTYEGLYKGTWIHPNPRKRSRLYGQG